MIKAVIFDIGGVILRTEDRQPRIQLEKRLGLKPGDAEYIVFNSEMGQKAQRGEITSSRLWAWVQEYFKFDYRQLARFQEEFWAGDQIDWEMVELIASLRNRFQLAIISNAMDNLPETIARFDPDDELFEVIVGSAAEKIMKPDPRIFKIALDRLHVLPNEAVFIDDFAHNIKGAQEVGLQTIHFQPSIDLQKEIALLGVR